LFKLPNPKYPKYSQIENRSAVLLATSIKTAKDIPRSSWWQAEATLDALPLWASMYTPKREPLGKDPRKRQGVERMINLRKSFDGTGTAKKVQGKSTQRVMQKGRVQIY
jgi:hypothetical protein